MILLTAAPFNSNDEECSLTLKRSYEKLKEADAAIVVYDILDQASCTNAKVILQDLVRLKKNTIPISLVRDKTDLESGRKDHANPYESMQLDVVHMETNVLRGFGTRSLIQNLVTRVFPPFPPHIEYGDYLIDSLTQSFHNEAILANCSKAHLQRFDHRLLDKEDIKKFNAINSKRANYIKSVQDLTLFLIQKLRIVRRRVWNEDYMSLMECYTNYDGEENSIEIRRLKKLNIDVKSDIVDMQHKFESSMSRKKLKHCAKKTMAAALCVVSLDRNMIEILELENKIGSYDFNEYFVDRTNGDYCKQTSRQYLVEKIEEVIKELKRMDDLYTRQNLRNDLFQF